MRNIFHPGAFHSLLAAILALLVGNAYASNQVTARIGELVTAYEQAGIFSGTVLVAQSGAIVYEQGHGLANRVWNIPNAAETKFQIGSATKFITAIAVLRLVEERKVSLEGRISDYLPRFDRQFASKITIHELLSHSSGIPDYFSHEFYDLYKDRFYPREEFVETFIKDDLIELEPGVGNYSSSDYYILGLIIEEMTGRSYSDAVRDLVLLPAGMHDTGFDFFASVEPGMASGYVRNYLGFWTPPFEIVESSAFAAGALYSTAQDLFRLDQSLRSFELLPQAAVERLTTPVSTAPWREGVRFAYGLTIEELTVDSIGKKLQLQEFAGNTAGGYTSINTRIPENSHFISIQANAGPGYFDNRLHRLKSDIIATLYGVTVDPPVTDLEEILGRGIMAGTVDDITKAYNDLASKGTFATSERRSNRLGHDLLNARKYSDAIEVFELNARNYPDSSNVFSSLGEGYFRVGNLGSALANYQKALSLATDERAKNGANAKIREIELRLTE